MLLTQHREKPSYHAYSASKQSGMQVFYSFAHHPGCSSLVTMAIHILSSCFTPLPPFAQAYTARYTGELSSLATSVYHDHRPENSSAVLLGQII